MREGTARARAGSRKHWRHAELTRSGLGRRGTGPADRRQARAEQLARLTYDDILAARVAVGTVGGLIDRPGDIATGLGLSGIVAALDPSGLFPLERMERTLRVLTHEVIPALR